MKKKFLILAVAATLAFTFAFATACERGKDEHNNIVRVQDERGLNAYEYTLANTTATDREGRVAESGDEYNGNEVGVFYHTWHGAHEKKGEVLDITKIMAENKNYLTSDYLDVNSKLFHWWGEPLYGYYCSDDPWVITRHIELMIAMGIDFLVYDYTNSAMYDKEAGAIFELLQKYHDQGFKVPKVTFYTNSGSGNVILALYSKYYEQGLYKDLWYAPGGKPMIIGVSQITCSNPSLYEELRNEFFDFRESQWPDTTTEENLEIGFPWMNWCYPQKNYNGMMPVSLAQHPGAKMSYGKRTNYGRGYDWTKNRNYTSNSSLGTNYEGQWKTVLDNNAKSSGKKVKQVLVTGFNEWMAQKLDDGNDAFFVDTFSEEYSRDIEMMKGGYEDNFVIQTLTNTRKYKYSQPKHYIYSQNTMPLTAFEQSEWEGKGSEYRDMAGDALARNFSDAFGTTVYTDSSNRNDIVSVRVTHDSANLYVRVQVDGDKVTAYNGADKNWMNLLIKTAEGNDNSFGGFNYVINRSPKTGGKTTVEKSTGGYNWTDSGEADYAVSGNVILYRIPLSALGLSADNCYVRIKACDNVTKPDDIMDYYISGDSAPIGRFAYSYGY